MFWKRKPTLLETEIDRAVRELKKHAVGSDEYAKIVDHIVALQVVKEEEKSDPLSKDTLAVVGANLLSIIMIIKHEHVNVIASRAMQLLLRTPRI